VARAERGGAAALAQHQDGQAASAPVKRLLTLSFGAALCGASGLGLEVLATDLAGLTLGYGSAGPIALALFLAGWALGARLAGGWRGDSRRALLAVGLWLAGFGALGPHLVVGAAAGAPALAGLVTVLVLFGVAVPQGAYLPLLARGWPERARGDLGPLFAANLVGAAVGASLFGDELVRLGGRGLAAAGAGACALLAAACGAWALSRRGADAPVPNEVPNDASARAAEMATTATESSDHAGGPRAGVLTPRAAGLALAGATAWVGALEWFGVRLGVLWLGGMQDALGSILVASLLALAVGAALLPRLLPNTRGGVAALGALCALASLWPFFLHEGLDSLGDAPLLLRAFVLIGPAVFAFGAWPPVLHRALAGDSARRLGWLLGWEALGALIGLPLVHFVLLPALGLGGALLALFGVAVVVLALRPPRGAAAVAALGFGLACLARPLVGVQPALDSPPLQNPAFTIHELREDVHFAVSVVEDGLVGERTLLTDGFRAAASGRDYAYMRALAHLPLLLHQSPSAVGVLAFGTGTTAGALSQHERMESLEVLELSEAVAELAPWFVDVNRGVLEDPRVTLTLGDGRHTLARRAGAYDVLTMEPLLPDSPFGVYLYTEEFYVRARGALKPGGLLCQWVPPHALEPATFEAVVGAFTSAFEWSSVWVFGTQVILLGGERAPQPSPARIPSGGELAEALAELGLDSIEGVLARYVSAGAHWPAPARPLTDLDPWIVYTPRRRGGVLLSDLPRNLATLRARQEDLPTSWYVGLGGEADERRAAVTLVREAREAFELGRARPALQAAARGDSELTPRSVALEVLTALDEAGTPRGVTELLDDARRRAPGEPSLARLEDELEFLTTIRRGVALLAQAVGERSAAEAAVQLERAVALRPERADVHAYLAVALDRMGDERAALELAKARELCPTLDRTAVGERLRQLGLTR